MAWNPLGTPLPVLVRYGYTIIYNTERVTSVFNYGFGDLAISDERIGANAVSQYNAIELHSSATPPGQADRTVLRGYASAGWPTDIYPGNVQTVDGGALEQRANVENDGWIERRGSVAGRFIQMDISGRLLRQASGGFENLTCQVVAEYQLPGSNAWQPMPFSPMTLSNGSTRPLRETFSAMLPQAAAKFRVRRVTPEYTDANNVAEIEWTRLKVFRDTDALYPAQLRRGMMVKATGQLNGRIDRYSALLRHKCWVWNSSAPWDGSMPAVGAGAWQWTYSTNPAWLFLYFSRGGFLNSYAAPAHLGQAGWLDEPSASNGERLFGAGLPNARIDYGTLVAWGQYCAAAQLTCRMLLSGARSAGTVLDDIAAAGRARKTWAPGKLSVWWERDGQPWVAAFGASNIIAGTFKIAYITDDTVDEFGLSYSQSDNDYEADTVYAKVPGVTLPVNQQVNQATYSMPKAQAQRLVNLLAASKYYHRRTITWESSIMGLTVATGDIIQLGHDLTRWAFSGRLIGLGLTGTRVAWVDLSAEVELPDGNDFYLMVTPPGGDPFSVRCAKPVGRSRRLTLVDNWPASAAPGWLDAGTPNPQTSAEWEDTAPEDWTFLGGPQQTPGKRVRIISMEPSSSRRVRMTVRDEYEQYYPLEWGLGVVPEVASGERRVARAFNLSAAPLPDGGTRLAWELEAAHGADVRVSVNSGPSQQVPVAGHITVLGRELLLPPYPAGTRLAVSLLPVTAGAPVGVEGDALNINL
jgi:hypothetical protein